MPKLKNIGRQVINQKSQDNKKIKNYLKQQLEEARKKVDRLEKEINEFELAS